MSDPQKNLYVLPTPTDSEERRRLDIQHHCITLICGGVYYSLGLVEATLSAPTDSRHAIIDIGTGSGAWAQDMAKAFPNADVTGVDIAPPNSSLTTPPNCDFRFEDANKGFSHYGKRYSIVHMRMITHVVTDFRMTLHEVAEIINPGGLLLVGTAMTGSYDEDKKSLPILSESEPRWCAIQAYQHAMDIFYRKTFPTTATRSWVESLRKDHMYDPLSVSEQRFYIPLGTWVSDKPGHSPSEVEAGRIMRVNFKRLFPLWLDTMVKDGTFDPETLNRWLKAALKEMDEMSPPLYVSINVTWARRSQLEWSTASANDNT